MPKYLDGTGLQALCERLNTSFIKTNAFSRAININTVAGENTVTIPSDFLTSDEYDSMVVFLDGLRLVKNSDYTFNSSTRVLTFVDTFITGDVVTVGIYTNGYDEVASAAFPALSAGVLTSDGTNMSWKNFTKMVYTQDITSANESVIIPQANLNNAVVTEVFRNGLLMVETDDYSINSSTREITFVVPLAANEKIVVVTQNAIVNSNTVFSGASLQNSTANTPQTNDNSTNVATTAYVKNNLNNYVDLSSSQTISGSKTFTGPVMINNSENKPIVVRCPVMQLGDTSVLDYANVWFEDSQGSSFGCLETGYYSDGSTRTKIAAYNASGNSSTVWAWVDADGTAKSYAPTPDTSSNNTQIATTAFVKSNLSSYLPLSGGTMTGDILFKSNDITRGTAPSSNFSAHCLDVRDSNDRRIGLIGAGYLTDKSSAVVIDAYNTTVSSGNSIGALAIGCNSSGQVYTIAPTPDTTSNDTSIATTAYVNNKFANPIEKVNAITSAASITINPNTGSLFTLTLGVNSSITIGNLSGGPYSTNGATITLYLTNTNKTISWNSKITWVSGEAPDVTSNPSIITFVTFNGGAKWYGSSIEVES